jgi:hypothetical protein
VIDWQLLTQSGIPWAGGRWESHVGSERRQQELGWLSQGEGEGEVEWLVVRFRRWPSAAAVRCGLELSVIVTDGRNNEIRRLTLTHVGNWVTAALTKDSMRRWL